MKYRLSVNGVSRGYNIKSFDRDGTVLTAYCLDGSVMLLDLRDAGIIMLQPIDEAGGINGVREV